ncbi:hypothetical protein KAI65_05900 [Candidatus Parcubacteria bacterium]|nr:hypothetical protein [Candidatus Parcubacteria bacterium]
MDNPWQKINTKNKPYILDCDQKTINEYNERPNRNNNHKIRLDNLPTPYAGDFNNAKILLLQKNPGSEIFPGLEPTENYEFMVYKNLKNDILKSLEHKKIEFPFYWLNPEYILTGGFRYWTRIFSSIIKEKNDYKKIANKVCCVQYFPYHSRKYNSINCILKSQKYSFNLVRNFIKKSNRIIVLMRAKREWLKVVPELKNYATLKSKINPVLTKNNFEKKEDYELFLKYLN